MIRMTGMILMKMLMVVFKINNNSGGMNDWIVEDDACDSDVVDVDDACGTKQRMLQINNNWGQMNGLSSTAS